KVTDADNNIREFSYDGLGRRLTAQDLHASGDGTYGTWTYVYDDAGNMTQKVDPKGQTINYTYDSLNRVLTEDYTTAGGTEATYSYDSGTDGKTRLTQAVMTGSATTTYAYNPLGLTKTETKAITGGSSYTTTYDYDRQGNQTQITYPDNAEVKYTYNNGGMLETVQRKESGGSFTDVVTDFDYAPTGQVSFTANANGTETTNTYDANELYRLKTKLTKLSSCGACGGEEAPEGWLPSEFMVLAEQVVAPVMDFLSPSETTEDSSTSVASGKQEPAKLSAPASEDPLATDGLIKNVREVHAWRDYHKERVEYLKTQTDLPPRVLEQALHGQKKFEDYLQKKGYADREGNLKRLKISLFLDAMKGKVKRLLAAILPKVAYAYVFGKEDFESCSSLPCSFTSNVAWGSVTASLDSTSQVQGTKSLKNVVSGEGGGAMKKSGLSTSEMWVQFKIKVPNPVTWGASGYFSMLTLQDSSSNAKIWLNVEDYGSPRIILDGDNLPYTNTGLDLTAGATSTVEIRVKMGTSNGDVDIWLNNTTQGSPNYNGFGT
ncbi:MAG TPA: hypothetical protein VHK27_03060, partial [Gammaproteobacteria bacterium]|nr:hypothetical protein [Gammaproteobacteria bacterium]